MNIICMRIITVLFHRMFYIKVKVKLSCAVVVKLIYIYHKFSYVEQ